MAEPTLVSAIANNAGGTAGTTISFTYPASPAISAGDIAVAVVSDSSTAATLTATGWTVTGPLDNSAVLRSWLCTKVMAGGEQGTTVNWTVSSSRWAVAGGVYTGDGPLDVSVTSQNTSLGTNFSVPGYTPASSFERVVILTAAQRPQANSDGVNSWPAGFTQVADTFTAFSGASDYEVGVADHPLGSSVAAVGSTTGTWTPSTGQSRANTYVVTIEPLTAAPAGTDTGAALAQAGSVAAALSAAETGAGTDTGAVTFPGFSVADTGTGADSATPAASPAVADTGVAIAMAATVGPALDAADTGAGADTATPTYPGFTAGDTGAFVDNAVSLPAVVPVSAADTGHGVDTATVRRSRLIQFRYSTPALAAAHNPFLQEAEPGWDGKNLRIGPLGGGNWNSQPSALLTNVPEIHVDSYEGTDVARLAAACAAATALGAAVVLPDRTILVGNGFPMAGYSCSIRGRIAGWTPGGTPGTPSRSVIYADTQTGPVLDFTGFIWTRGFRSAMQFSDFAVRGSGVADATLANIGIFLDFQQGAGVAVWRNLVISNTGGPCFQASGLYLHNFENVRLVRPISAKTNDVPYMWVQNATQCNFALDLYSPDAVGASDDCGPGGCFVATDDGFFASTMNHVDIRCENIHMPTGGTIIHYAGNDSTIELRQSDCKQESGATGTSFIRLAVPAIQDFGGNTIQGVIRGSNGGTPICEIGNDIYQSRNRIVGAKGFKGNNVRLNSGVGYTYISLEGAHSGATDPGVDDISGETTNSIFDFIQYPGTGLPPVTPGIGISQTAYKTTVEPRTSTTTIAPDPELTLAMAVGTYSLEAFLRYDATATGKIKGQFVMDTGAGTGEWAFNGLTSSVTASVSGSINCADTALGANQVGGCAGAGTLVVARPVGIVEVTSAGNFVYSFAQNGSDATPTNLQPGSWMRMTKIA